MNSCYKQCRHARFLWVGYVREMQAQPSSQLPLTEGVVALRQRLQAPRLHLRQLAQLVDASCRQALRDEGPDARQLPRLQLAVGPQPLAQALGQQQGIEGLCKGGQVQGRACGAIARQALGRH